MSWKSYSYPKKGFVIGIIIGILIFSFGSYYNAASDCKFGLVHSENCGIFDLTIRVISLILYFPLALLGSVFGTLLSSNQAALNIINWTLNILTIPYLGALGTLIGWLIQKRKSKR